MSDQVLSIDDLFIVQSELSGVSHKWYDIGLQLKVHPDDLDKIKFDHNNANECFRELFAFVLRRPEAAVSWEVLATVLERQCIGADALAQSIRCNHSLSLPTKSKELLGISDYAFPSPNKKRKLDLDSPMISKPKSWDPIPLLPGIAHLELDSESVENLKAVLQMQSENLEKAFYDLFLSIKKSLIVKEVNPSELVGFYGSLKPQYENTSKPNTKDLKFSKNLDELFDLLSAFVSPFNYDLVKEIIEKLGTPADKELLQKYVDYFEEFCKRRVCEAPPCFCKKQESDTIVWVKKDDSFDTMTFQALRQFRFKLMAIFKVDISQLRLIDAKDGCVELILVLPSHISAAVFPLSLEQEEALRSENVKSLACDRYSFPKKEVTDPLNVVLFDIDKHITQKQFEKIKFFTTSIVGLQKMESVGSVYDIYLVLSQHMYDDISAVSILHCLLLKVGIEHKYIAGLVSFSCKPFVSFSSVKFCEVVVSIASYLGSETPSRRLMSVPQSDIASISHNIQTAIMRIFFKSQELSSQLSNFAESIHKIALWLNQISLWDLAAKLIHEAECLIDRDVHVYLLYSCDVDSERAIQQQLLEDDDLRHLSISFTAASRDELADISKIIQRGASAKLASLEVYCNPEHYQLVSEVARREVASVLSLEQDDIRVCRFFELITLTWDSLHICLYKAFTSAGQLNNEHITELLASYTSQEVDWAAHVVDKQGYTRSVVERNSQYEMAVHTLEAGCDTPIHSQGFSTESHCFIKVLCGTVKVTLFEWPDVDQSNSPMVVSDSRVYHANSVYHQKESMGLLHLENVESDSKAVTLHISTPPQSGTCQQFDRETGTSTLLTLRYSGGIPCIYRGNIPQKNMHEWDGTSKLYDVNTAALSDTASDLRLPSEVVKKISKSVCKVRFPTSAATSGFLVHFNTESRVIKGLLTASESLDLLDDQLCLTLEFDDQELQITTNEHFQFRCSILGVAFIAFDNDTILKLKKPFLTISTQKLNEKETLFVMQYLDEKKFQLGRGNFIEYYSLDLHYSLSPDSNFSGSPVFLDDGSVIGIHKAPLEMHSSAVTMEAVTQALFPFLEISPPSSNLVSNPKMLNNSYEADLFSIGLQRKSDTLNLLYVSPASVCAFITYMTPIWFVPTSHGWYWSPLNPSHRYGANWAPVSRLKVYGGFWHGQTPASINIAIIDWLNQHNIVCGVCPSD